jgi:hypothetical protein
MNTRVNPFSPGGPPVFTTETKNGKPSSRKPWSASPRRNNFPSRQAAKPPNTPRRKAARYGPGIRNQQFNAKATPETHDNSSLQCGLS